jgi:hypothetical protein
MLQDKIQIMNNNINQSPWVQVWQSSKSQIALFSAMIPLVMILGHSYFAQEPLKLTKLSIAFLAYQVSFIIALVFDVSKHLTSHDSKRITKIKRNDKFWANNGKYNFLYLSVLAGDSFVEMIDEKKIQVKNIKLIVPNDDAIETYFRYDPIVNDKAKSIHLAKEALSNIEDDLTTLKNNNLINSYEIRRTGNFPLDFYAIFDGKSCLVGKYTQDALRKNKLGLKSTSWLESSPQLISEYTNHFESVWDSLNNKTV